MRFWNCMSERKADWRREVTVMLMNVRGCANRLTSGLRGRPSYIDECPSIATGFHKRDSSVLAIPNQRVVISRTTPPVSRATFWSRLDRFVQVSRFAADFLLCNPSREVPSVAV
jgi:hypothetical protein